MGKNRIVWLDWAKVLGIMIVVFCHTPQAPSLTLHFFESMQMPLFFMISGYLHKCQPTFKESFLKYIRTLFIPYLLFQVIFYPYYAVRVVFDGQSWNILDHLIIPSVGVFWGGALDGPTWFLFALFVMKILADIACRTNEKLFVPLLCVASVVATYFIWGDEIVNISFCIDSLIRFYPFFFLGMALKKHGKSIITLTDSKKIHSVYALVTLLVISLLIVHFSPVDWNLRFPLFYIAGITGSFALIEFCKLLPSKDLIVEISSGTIIILGFHWMFIGTTNVLVEKILHMGHGVLYPLPIAFLLVFCITFACYFIILFCKKHFRMLLGGR